MSVSERQKVRVEWVPVSTVWVALATFTRAVRVNTEASTAPLSGGPMSIFSRPSAEVEQINSAEVLGVFCKEADARAATELHRISNAALNAEYTVELFPLSNQQMKVKEEPAKPTGASCIMCGTQLFDGTSYCARCRAERHRVQREADPGE